MQDVSALKVGLQIVPLHLLIHKWCCTLLTLPMKKYWSGRNVTFHVRCMV